jgi:hypothetical protein
MPGRGRDVSSWHRPEIRHNAAMRLLSGKNPSFRWRDQYHGPEEK